ncbi:magnesium transporter [Schnuerera sp. xch1]|uniref:magnesium transporter n=1 Tax=Schnuerera sp. xch1 TaxID=2874283 RepID=UPI001CBB15E0|nr:magnesium transporter [Schnuerera sp. xch1]MBZ2175081.1 magnesium transporter [Schnuerera sp. xch1]
MDERRLECLIQEKNYAILKKELEELNAVDVADLLEPLNVNTALLIFRMLSKDLAVEVFSSFSIDKQRDIIGLVTDKELKNIVEELFFDDMIDIIEEMPANVVKKILIHAKEEERNLINQFLRYPPDSAGSIMTIEYVDLKKGMTAKNALKHIKETGLDKETVYTCYVTDKNRKLEGIVSLRKLVISDENKTIEEIMDTDVIYVNTHDDQETVASIFKKYGFLALPVVDNENRLTGIITVDDIMEVIDQENTEDFQRMAAIAPSEEKYIDASVLSLAKDRVLWLLILMISATMTASIIRRFEDVLATIVVLTAFIPMLMNTGGNSGNQASTLVIRGISLGEIELKDAPKILWKEFRISLMVGIILSVVNFFKNYLFDRVGLLVSFTVSITLFITVVISKMIGGVLPMIAKKLNLDPAIMAGPLITTLVDVLSLIIYFSVAQSILNL